MPNVKGSAMFRVVTTVVALVVVGGVYFVFSALFSKQTRVPDEKIAPVKKEDIVRSVVATGKIEPVTKVEIKSKASGIIQKILVQEGDTVAKGQVLLELDRGMLEASFRESSANLLARMALKEKAEAELRSAALGMEKAKEEAKSMNADFAGREYSRMKQLADDRLISGSQLDEAEQRLRDEQLKQNVLRKEILVKEGAYFTAQKAIHQAEADIRAAEAVARRSEEDLANATIRSPIGGKVLKRFLEPGDAVSSILALGSNATLIMVVGDTSELFFKGEVDESDIGKIGEGLPVNLKVETFRDKVFQGEVYRISPMGQEKDNVTRFEVRVRIRGDASLLRPAMTANAEIVLEKRAGVMVVPETAVIFDGQKNSFVEVLTEKDGRQTVTRKAVKTGIGNGSRVEVVSGLSEGEKVVMQ